MSIENSMDRFESALVELKEERDRYKNVLEVIKNGVEWNWETYVDLASDALEGIEMVRYK